MGDRSDSSSSYPPVGSPDRYDMIVQRGRALRRRRRYTLGAGAGGTVVAIALAVVFVTSGGDGGDDLNATEVAGETTIATTTTTTTTTTTLPPSVGDVTVAIDPATRTVTVSDLTLPVSEASRQCLHLGLRSPDDQLVAELHQCNYYEIPAPGAISLDLLPAEGTEISCATNVERPLSPPVGAAEFISTFVYGVAEIPPGEYSLTAGATSGIGDGCAYAEDTSIGFVEDVNFETATIEIP